MESKKTRNLTVSITNNSTNEDVGSVLEWNYITSEDDDDSYDSSTRWIQQSLPIGATTKILLESYHGYIYDYDPLEIASAALVLLHSAGVTFRGRRDAQNLAWKRAVSVTVKDGDELELIDNVENPRLSIEHYRVIEEQVLAFRELGMRASVNELDDDKQHPEEQEMWSRLAKEYKKPSPEQLQASYRWCGLPHRTWYELYRPLEPTAFSYVKELQSTLTKHPFEVHLYWRALASGPFDDTEWFTIRYVLQLYPNDESRNSIECFSCVEYDSDIKLHGPLRPDYGELSGLCAKYSALILEQPSLNSTFNIMDTHCSDDDAIDVEWSSVEMVAFASVPWDPWDTRKSDNGINESIRTLLLVNNRAGSEANLNHDTVCHIASYICPKQPIFRLHQHSQNHPNTGNPPVEPVNATIKQAELIQLSTNVVNMGRVMEWAEREQYLDQEVLPSNVQQLSQAEMEYELTIEQTPPRTLGYGTEVPIVFRF